MTPCGRLLTEVASVLYRPSQSAEYWTSEFQLTEDDLEFLQAYILQEERPVTDARLAHALIEHRFHREEQRISQELARGTLYQPKNDYEIGDTVVFPALDFAVGTVVDKRPGKNPEHGEFNVITVEFEGGDKPRMFAAALKTPHKLNQENGEAPDEEALKDPEALYDLYGNEVRTRLAEELASKGQPEFVNLGRNWMLASLLAEVHVGHRNIAEALIEVQGQPLPTSEILPELDLPQEISPAAAAFSVDLSLSQDPRFIDVGIESRLWHLRRLLPEEATTIPRRLQVYKDIFDRSAISVPLLQLEWEIDDEWTEGDASSRSTTQAATVSLTLTYPHRRSGTLPLSSRTRSFFPVREDKHSMITFIDGRWGKRFPGWVVPEGRYVCGLHDWYEEHKLPVGAYLQLERTDNPTEIIIDFRPRRMRREWVRMARVENDQLVFQLQKQAIACEYDEEMVIAEDDPQAIDELRRNLYRLNPTVYELLEVIAPNLMGLSTQGTVHAKTVYSAINLVRRTTPGPIFAALCTNPRFHDVGSGYFALARP